MAMPKRSAAPAKTNACRALERAGVGYELRAYAFDPADLAAERVAAKLGIPVERVYKTLCLRADSGAIALAVVAGHRELDLKAAARAAAVRSFSPVAVKELPGLTGYVRGGVTALATKRPLPVYFDERGLGEDTISVSAGQRGLQLLLAPADYVRATGATVAALSRPKAMGQAP